MPPLNWPPVRPSAHVFPEDPDSNYLLKIDLNPVNWKKKKDIITRTLSVPADCTFTELHRAIYTAFQWKGSHLWKFTVKDGTEMRTQTQKRRTADLLEIYHLRGYSQEWRDLGPPALEADTTTICTVFEDTPFKGKVVEYLWDFGDEWDHYITVQGRPTKDAHITLGNAQGKIPPKRPPFIHPMFTERDRKQVVEGLAALGPPQGHGRAHTPCQWPEESGDEAGNGTHDSSGTRQANVDRDPTTQRRASMEVPRVLKRGHVGNQQAEEMPGIIEEYQRKRPRMEAA